MKKTTGKKEDLAFIERCFKAVEWLILLSPFLFGLFFAWTAALAGIFLSILLLLMLRRKVLHPVRSPLFLACLAIVLFHLLGALWGTDRGMAPIGAVQFLPLPLFVLVLEQFDPEKRQALLRNIPYAACVMVLLSLAMSFITPLEGWFVVAGRQAGFFQYPNTYALYLLTAVVLVLFGKPLRFGRLPWLIVLLAGIILSGSRTVLLLLAGVLLFYLLREPDRKKRRLFLALLFLLAASGGAYILLTGDRTTVGRFLTISLSSSELLGRFLYVRDALPVILKHPLGLGYFGFYWIQGGIQTGVYSVRHVHNELVQLLLDVGWIPAGLFLWTLFRGCFSKNCSLCRRIMILAIVLHCLLDFDTQFVSVCFLLLLAMDTEAQAMGEWKQNRMTAGVLAAGILLSAWIGTASFLHYLRRPESALGIYPWHTQALTELLSSSSEDEMEERADRILRLNKSVSLAYDVKARTAFSEGDTVQAVEYKQKAIRLARFNLAEYTDYFDLLRYGYQIYRRDGENESAAWCVKRIREIPGMLQDAENRLSWLGRRIKDQPNLELPADYLAWLQSVG